MSSTAVVQHVSQLPVTSMAELATGGQLLAQAGYLGTRSPGEGFLILAACQQEGLSLVDFQSKYHFRQGRFSKQAHELLAQLTKNGGAYKIIERSPNRAALELTKDGNTYTSEITWEQALGEPFPYAGNEADQLAELAKPIEKRRLKAKYQTPRSRMQMLWARAVSDGVVVVDPGARGGVYTPEETDDIIDATAAPAGAHPVAVDPVSAAKRVEAIVTPVAMPEPVRTVPASAPSPVVDTDPNPFAMAAAKSINFGLCPVPDCPVTGKPWSQFEVEELQAALAFQHPCMMPEHYNEIRAALAAKGVK